MNFHHLLDQQQQPLAPDGRAGDVVGASYSHFESMVVSK